MGVHYKLSKLNITPRLMQNDKEESMNDKIFHCVWLKVFDEEFQLEHMTSFIKKV